MTCREFKRTAAELGLQQVSRAQYPPMAAHAAECSQCESWMQEQRMLAGAMQTLSLRTSRCEAGVDVERALLRAFRQNAAARPAEPVRFPPLALRLSRWFGMGAYAAVAAAVLVGLFLGYRVWQHPATVPVQGQNSATVSAPVDNDSNPARGSCCSGWRHGHYGSVRHQRTCPGRSYGRAYACWQGCGCGASECLRRHVGPRGLRELDVLRPAKLLER